MVVANFYCSSVQPTIKNTLSNDTFLGWARFSAIFITRACFQWWARNALNGLRGFYRPVLPFQNWKGKSHFSILVNFGRVGLYLEDILRTFTLLSSVVRLLTIYMKNTTRALEVLPFLGIRLRSAPEGGVQFICNRAGGRSYEELCMERDPSRALARQIQVFCRGYVNHLGGDLLHYRNKCFPFDIGTEMVPSTRVFQCRWSRSVLSLFQGRAMYGDLFNFLFLFHPIDPIYYWNVNAYYPLFPRDYFSSRVRLARGALVRAVVLVVDTYRIFCSCADFSSRAAQEFTPCSIFIINLHYFPCLKGAFSLKHYVSFPITGSPLQTHNCHFFSCSVPSSKMFRNTFRARLWRTGLCFLI